jgi:hypothetical protein
MKFFETLQGKKVALYVRKEKGEEITTSGYGRLQWIEDDIKEYVAEMDIFIDEYEDVRKLHKVIQMVNEFRIEAIVLWTIDDIDLSLIKELVDVCSVREVELISFWEHIIPVKRANKQF